MGVSTDGIICYGIKFDENEENYDLENLSCSSMNNDSLPSKHHRSKYKDEENT